MINLKDLNKFLAFHHFKMESFQTAKDLMQEGNWMIKQDLKEAYHSVPVTPEVSCLPFGWQMLCLLCSCLSVWLNSTGVYQNHKTDSCSYSTESGDPLCYVFRRPFDF